MSGIHATEFLLICVIALIILGPKRLPEVANKIGGWVGKARRMTRVLKRQLEEELDLEQGLNVRPKIQAYVPPNDDDTFSPMHPPAGAMKVEAETEAETSTDQPDPATDEPAAAAQESAAAEEAATDDDGERRTDT